MAVGVIGLRGLRLKDLTLRAALNVNVCCDSDLSFSSCAIVLSVIAKALTVTLLADIFVHGSSFVVTKVLSRVVLVFSINENSWGHLDLIATTVLANDRFAAFFVDVDVGKLHLAHSDSGLLCQFLPLSGECVTSGTVIAYECDNPNVFSVLNNRLLEGLNCDFVGSGPSSVILSHHGGLVGSRDHYRFVVLALVVSGQSRGSRRLLVSHSSRTVLAWRFLGNDRLER